MSEIITVARLRKYLQTAEADGFDDCPVVVRFVTDRHPMGGVARFRDCRVCFNSIVTVTEKSKSGVEQSYLVIEAQS